MNRVNPRNLSVRDLRDELRELEESWMETLLRGSDDDLDDHAVRTRQLEEEFDRRARGDAPPPERDAVAEQAQSRPEAGVEQPRSRPGAGVEQPRSTPGAGVEQAQSAPGAGDD
ncbi:hypothetical protein Ssi03_08930 [Sphaerisporangium siamense]|uniref:Uncharacterized protein n=1 Tax=Sphaerisporangium siamense TaxID=795645 RepID=A0A7W7DH99_9ACTN|nr:DUF6158 family protein [Sphaerisporangium siamense]MBB4705711.1 hypothetical protein [Sphaerisporangium siamense]GII82903.1 hypothetical protein Ssi03_08930 [Sphaerisporangium siamense]